MSDALEMIAEALAKKSEEGQSATTTALQSGDFSKTIEEINLGVKAIKVDTEEILKNQKTIIDLQKKKESDKKGGIVEEAGGSKEQENKLKTGIGIILLIAIAVLAIGAAFKLIGDINFLSVIGLSLSILILANAFAKLAELNFTIEQAELVAKTMVIMALAVTISSWIFSLIIPLSFGTLITAVLIGGAFTLLAPSIAKFIKGIEDIEISALIKAVVFLPIILPAIALGIALASWAFALVKPIGFGTAISSILIAAIFTVVSFGIRKMLKAFDGMSPKELVFAVIFLPLILPAIALGIAGASYALQLVRPIGFMQFFSSIMVGLVFVVLAFGLRKMIGAFKGVTVDEAVTAAFVIPILYIGVTFAMMVASGFLSQVSLISFGQFLTALGISILFVVISFAVSLILKIANKLDWADVLKLPALFTLMSLAIAVSSYILFQAKEYLDGISFGLMIKIVVFSIAFAISVIAIAVAMASLKILNIGPGEALKGGITIVIIAAAVAISSVILSMGTYENAPPLMWTLGAVAAIGAFGLAAFLLGTQATNPMFYAGMALILLVAATILATSHILGAGNYKNFPGLQWILGVGASLAGFAAGAILLGLNVLNPFFYAGLPMLMVMAETIVKVSKTIAKGTYNLPGLGTWAASVALLFGTFTPLIILLGAVGAAGAVLEFFGADNPFEKGREMLGQIAQTIVDVAAILAKGKFVGGPTKEWAESVGIAIGAFSPVYAMMVKSAIFEALGMAAVGPEEFNTSIRTVVGGIVAAADAFAEAKGSFKEGPSETWAKGVGSAIGAFAPVYQSLILAGITGDESLGPEGMVKAVETMTRGIIKSAEIFAENKAKFEEGNYPSENWGKGVGAALNAFSPVFDSLNEKSWWQSGDDVIGNMVSGVTRLAGAIVGVAFLFNFAKASFETYPEETWTKAVEKTIVKFVAISEYLTNKPKVQYWRVNDVTSKIVRVAQTIFRAKEAFEMKIDPGYVDSLSQKLQKFTELANYLTTNSKTQYWRVNDVSSRMVKLAKTLFGAQKEFQMVIDPNYMKNVGQNMIDFNEIVKKLAESESDKEGLFGSITGAAEGLLGTDPISQIANRMVTLAKGYDAMANSLMKLSTAMKMLNVNSLKELGGFTKSLLGRSPAVSQEGGQTPIFRRNERAESEMPSVSPGSKAKTIDPFADPKKNSISYVSEKLEELIKIMAKIERSTSTIDEAVELYAGIKPPPEISDFG